MYYNVRMTNSKKSTNSKSNQQNSRRTHKEPQITNKLLLRYIPITLTTLLYTLAVWSTMTSCSDLPVADQGECGDGWTFALFYLPVLFVAFLVSITISIQTSSALGSAINKSTIVADQIKRLTKLGLVAAYIFPPLGLLMGLYTLYADTSDVIRTASYATIIQSSAGLMFIIPILFSS